ncbi:MAG: hypothetical protein ABIR47_01060, partial [Candidatus Kapaibacterium sp.]
RQGLDLTREQIYGEPIKGMVTERFRMVVVVVLIGKSRGGFQTRPNPDNYLNLINKTDYPRRCSASIMFGYSFFSRQGGFETRPDVDIIAIS